MKSTALVRYNRRVVMTGIGYVVVILAVTWIFKHRQISVPLNYILAALPALPVIGMIASFGIYLAEEKDDFQRAILMTSSVWATGVVLSVATFWGFIENYTTVVRVPMYWTFVLWGFVLGLVQPLLRRRYR